MAVDHGTRRIGIAVGNTADRIASPVKVVAAEPASAAIEQIKSLMADYQVDGLVVGWPLNMDGTEGPQGELARGMAVALADAANVPVRLWDERLSSFVADVALRGLLTRKKRRARQDAIAAAAILQDFLNSGTVDEPAPHPRDVKPEENPEF